MPTTHKPASPTSIHSYVSVRPARKIAAEAEEQHFCIYDADHPSPFVQSLISIKADTNLTEKVKLEQIQTAAKNFKGTTGAFTTQESLRGIGSDILRFAESLSAKRD